LTFAIPILLIFLLSSWLFSYKWLTISYSYPRVTTYELALAMLVSLPNLNIVTAVDGVIVCAFSSILFNFFYRNYSSDCITKPYRKYYDRLVNGLGM
jgi:hypothetical protein